MAPTTTVPPTTLSSVEGVFSAGYGIADITPVELPIPLSTTSSGTNLQENTSILSPIYATCLAITDAEGNTVLLFSLDLLHYDKVMDPMLESISKATGVPVENICVSCSHTHASPDIDRTDDEVIIRYNQMMEQRMVEAAVAALADRRQAELFGATVETRLLNYCMRDGCSDPTCYDADVLRESEPDSTLQLIKFVREGGKEIILTNFQGHPNTTWGAGISSDVIGLYKDALTAEKDCEVIYFTGASAGINTVWKVNTVGYTAWGKKLAKYALSAEELYQPIATGKVQVRTYTFEGQVRPDGEDPELEAYCAQYRAGEISRDDMTKILKDKGVTISDNRPFTAILDRIERGATDEIGMTAVSFGAAGFIAAPYEMFDTNGKFIKENSPFDMTIVATQSSGGWHRYIPCKMAWRHAGYEVECAIYVEGTAEALADQYVAMLTELYQSK